MESQSSLSTLSSGKKVPSNVTSRSTPGIDSEARVKLLEGSFTEKVDQGKGPISLPIELLGEIGMYLEDSYDRLSFCLTVRCFFLSLQCLTLCSREPFTQKYFLYCTLRSNLKAFEYALKASNGLCRYLA